MTGCRLRSRHLLVALMLSGCGVVTTAHLQTPAPDCLAQLRAFVEQQTGRPAQIDARSFARSDLLQLQPETFRDAQRRPLDGRSLGRPETFRLLTVDGVCTVEHARSGTRAGLDGCDCAAPHSEDRKALRSRVGPTAA